MLNSFNKENLHTGMNSAHELTHRTNRKPKPLSERKTTPEVMQQHSMIRSSQIDELALLFEDLNVNTFVVDSFENSSDESEEDDKDENNLLIATPSLTLSKRKLDYDNPGYDQNPSLTKKRCLNPQSLKRSHPNDDNNPSLLKKIRNK